MGRLYFCENFTPDWSEFTAIFQWGLCCAIFGFLCIVLQINVCCFGLCTVFDLHLLFTPLISSKFSYEYILSTHGKIRHKHQDVINYFNSNCKMCKISSKFALQIDNAIDKFMMIFLAQNLQNDNVNLCLSCFIKYIDIKHTTKQIQGNVISEFTPDIIRKLINGERKYLSCVNTYKNLLIRQSRKEL